MENQLCPPVPLVSTTIRDKEKKKKKKIFVKQVLLNECPQWLTQWNDARSSVMYHSIPCSIMYCYQNTQHSQTSISTNINTFVERLCVLAFFMFNDSFKTSTKANRYAMLINSYDFRQPITDVYCGQLTNESARFLQH